MPIVVSQPTTIGWFPGGGWSASQTPLSGTFVVGANGHVIISDEWGNGVLEMTISGNESTLASVSNAGPTGIDNYGNLYVAADGYSGAIFKIPYNFSTGTYTGFTTAPTVNCLGGTQDAAPCLFAPNFAATVFTNGSGYSDLVFDSSGNLFIATSTVPVNNANSIYECNAACQTSSTGTPTLLYADPNPIGALAIDPWGNLFFSDGNNSTGEVTSLNELPYQSNAYATTPTVLSSYTNKAGYGNGFSGVAVDSNGTIYFATNADGIFAIPNTQAAGPNLAGTYAISTGGGYGITLDSKGNVYLVHYGTPPSGTSYASYAVDSIAINNLSLGAVMPGGTAATATANILDSNGSCSPTLTVAANSFGAASSEFSAAAGSSCSAALGTGNGTFSPALSLTGSVISATITFDPKQAGGRSAMLITTDAAANAVGEAALSGTGQAPLANLDPGVWAAFTSGWKSPASVVADPAGDVFVADSGAGKVFEIAAGATTPVAVGSGFTAPDALAFDANGNLFVADNGVPDIVEIPNTGTTGAFAAGTQQTIVSATTDFGGTPLASPIALAVDPEGTLYITDAGNKRVVSYSIPNGQPGTTLADAANGLENPMGIAVDGASNLYVADASLNEVLIVASGGGISTITPPNVTQAVGVAVDASGSVLVADGGTGNIVRIPDLSGTLTTASAIVIETVPAKVSSLWMDAQGDLFATSASGSSVYSIQRTAASINLGTVQDGATNSGTVYLMNAGNATATLASPAISASSSAMFNLAAAATNGCTDGLSGPAGTVCDLTATFAPPVNTANGSQSGTATVSFSSPPTSATVTMTGMSSVSSIQGQTITGFSPNTPILVGQQITLSATGGGSNEPVVFSIDPGSPCVSCATVNGTTLTAVAAGSVIVDANQAAGMNGGVQYAQALQVQATVVINNATAAGVPALLMSQSEWYGLLNSVGGSGGFTDGQNPAGGSFAVDANGDVIAGNTYGNQVYLFNGQTGAGSVIASINGPGGITTDSQNNLYVSHLYNSVVLKVPFVNGAYVTLTDTTPSACAGSDTALCTFANAGSNNNIKAIAFDASGNFYMVTVPGSTGGNSIYECGSGCLPSGAGTLIYADPNPVSSVAADQWGNVFFTDAVYTDESDAASSSSSLNELPMVNGKLATSPTVLQTLSETSTNYDNELDGVAVGSDGTVYYATQNDGIFAIPNTQAGGPNITGEYQIATQGGKALELSASGGFYVAGYTTINGSSGDGVGQVLVNNLITPVAQLNGAPVTASATVVDNAFGCDSPATLAIASSNPEFTATGGTSCSSVSSSLSTPIQSSSYPATITFAATKGGPQTSTLTVTDTTNGGEGTATVTGIGQETPQAITFTAPTTTTYTYIPGLTITLGATGGDSGNAVVFSVDSSSTGDGTIAGDTLTVTTAGTIVIDANQAAGLNSSTGIYYSQAPQVQLSLTVNQATQAISFTAPATPVTYSSGLTISLTATGGDSGNPVVFTVDGASTGAGTVSGNVLTVTTAGTIVIDANQAGNANYSAALQVQQTVVVNQATQAITFTPPSAPIHFIVGGIAINLVATGGGSGNPVVFTIDSSSTGAGTIAGSVLTVTAQGTLVIDANQAGNANYLAAPQVQETIAVLSPLPTQTITFANPGTQVVGTPLTLTATASSGFPVSFTSGTTSVCTVAQSDSAWTATFVAAGTCTITAAQPGDNATYAAAPAVAQTFTVNPAGQAPAISLGFSLSSLTLAPGTVGLTQLTVNSQNNFIGTVSFACSGLPSGYSCIFNPNPISIPQGGAASTSLSINPSTSAAAGRRDSRPLFPVTTLAVAICLLGFKKKSRTKLLLLVVIGITGLGLFTGCGGSSSPTAKATTTTATVTATSGSVKQSATLTIIVE